MSKIHSKTSIKMVGEALRYAQSGMLNTYPAGPQRDGYAKIIQDLINDVNRQRPIGNDGKHGDLHTENCGCELSETEAAQAREARRRRSREAAAERVAQMPAGERAQLQRQFDASAAEARRISSRGESR